MVLIGEYLNDAVHKVLLSHGVLTDDYDLKDLGQDHWLVDVVGKALQVTKTDDVLANGYS